MKNKLILMIYPLISIFIVGTNMLCPGGDHIDFENKKDEAQKWGEEKYKNWFEDLSLEEKGEIKDFSKHANFVNNYLVASKGEFITDKNKFKEKERLFSKYSPEELIEKTKIIDSALKKTKLPESTILYFRVDLAFFSMGNLVAEHMKPESIARKLEKQFLDKTIIHNDFLVTSLLKQPTDNVRFWDTMHPIIIKIKVPSSTRAAYLGKNSYFDQHTEMIIARGHSLNYENFSVVNGTTKKLIHIEASLI